MVVDPTTQFPASTVPCCLTGHGTLQQRAGRTHSEENPSGTAMLTLNCQDYEGKVREPSVADTEGYSVWSQMRNRYLVRKRLMLLQPAI